MMNQPERMCSHRPLDTFRSQVKQCQQVLVEKQATLDVFSQQFVEEHITAVDKALCNEVLSHLAQSREALQTLQVCFDKARQMPFVLPLYYILPTNIRYALSCMAAFERELVAYRATRRSSLVKRADAMKNIESHFHMLFLNLEELLNNVSVCLDQSHFEENALLERQKYRPKAPHQLSGRVIPLRRSFTTYVHTEKSKQDHF